MTSSRRTFLLGTASAALASGCAHKIPATDAEAIGAFPTLPAGAELIGPQAGIVRLHSNENPYGPAASALKMVEYAGRKGAFYADRATDVLTKMIAERYDVDPQQVTLSTGSAEALSAAAIVYGQQGPIVAPRLFFDATVMYANRLGLAQVQRAPMTAALGIDFAALDAMVTTDTGMVQLCNPNNPTGVLSDTKTLKAAVKRMAAKTTVVVDEAYMELTDAPQGNSCIDLVRAGHDVIISRTFSKLYGMAGLRVGYLISSAEAAQKLRAAKMSWMSGVSLAAAIGCLDDDAFIRRSLAKINEGREMTVAALRGLGIESLPSQTNFVYFKSGKSANALQHTLRASNVQIRGQYMDYDAWSRVSMGRLQDVARFCQTLPEAINA